MTHFGLFVTIDSVYVDGLVHVTALPGDYYHLQDGGLSLAGERTGTTFSLGDRLEVEVARVNVEEGKLDFELAMDASSRGDGRVRRGGRGRRKS